MKKLITKNEFIDVLKNNYPVTEVIEKYSSLPETITVDNDVYQINNIINLSDDVIYSVSLNYYNKANFKFLYTYKIETNVLVAVNNLFDNYSLNKVLYV